MLYCGSPNSVKILFRSAEEIVLVFARLSYVVTKVYFYFGVVGTPFCYRDLKALLSFIGVSSWVSLCLFKQQPIFF